MRRILPWLLFRRAGHPTAVRYSMYLCTRQGGIADRANEVVTAKSALWRQTRLVCLMLALPAMPCLLNAQTPPTEPAAAPMLAPTPAPGQEPTVAPRAALPEQS